MTEYGDTGYALVLQPGYPVPSYDEANRLSLLYRYACRLSALPGILPAFNDPPPDPAFSTLKRREVTTSPGHAPGWAWVDIQYRQPGGSRLSAVGDVERETSVVATERPIDEWPGLSEAQKAAKLAAGINSFTLFAVTYTRREVVSSNTFSEANAVSGVGATGSPTGLSSATGANWLKTSRRLSEGDTNIVEETWQYNGDGWSGKVPL